MVFGPNGNRFWGGLGGPGGRENLPKVCPVLVSSGDVRHNSHLPVAASALSQYSPGNLPYFQWPPHLRRYKLGYRSGYVALHRVMSGGVIRGLRRCKLGREAPSTYT
jgi:hypothetical protein